MITESQNTGADINLANNTIVLSAGLWRIAIAVDYSQPQTTGTDPRSYLNSRIIEAGGGVVARAKSDQYQRYYRTTDRKYYVDHMFFLDDPISVLLQTGLISRGSTATPELSSTGGQIQILMHNSIRGKDGSPRYVRQQIHTIAGQSVVTLARMVDKLFTAGQGTTTFQINSDQTAGSIGEYDGASFIIANNNEDLEDLVVSTAQFFIGDVVGDQRSFTLKADESVLVVFDNTSNKFRVIFWNPQSGSGGGAGEKGDTGDTGATGEKGDTGATGAKGDAGEDGAGTAFQRVEVFDLVHTVSDISDLVGKSFLCEATHHQTHPTPVSYTHLTLPTICSV